MKAEDLASTGQVLLDAWEGDQRPVLFSAPREICPMGGSAGRGSLSKSFGFNGLVCLSLSLLSLSLSLSLSLCHSVCDSLNLCRSDPPALNKTTGGVTGGSVASSVTLKHFIAYVQGAAGLRINTTARL